MSKIRTLVVDDSALMREILQEILSQDPEIEVVGTASDPFQAREKILRLNPDVLTLDVEMPRMDGLSFLEKLMRAHPMPVVMVSSLTKKGCETAVRALELGAIDCVAKPRLDVRAGTMEQADEIIHKVKAAAQAQLRRRNRPAVAPSAAVGHVAPQSALFNATNKVVAIGASTGGTEALAEVLTSLPADAPGMVIVQHMPAGFTRAFAQRLDSICRVRVKEARDGDPVLTGHALIAPGSFQMSLVRSGAANHVRVFPGEPVNHHRPSVDVLFEACAKELGSNAVGVIMTGMGADGARGLLAMRRAGAHTIAQDEATCVVFGMPGEAIAMGGAEEIKPLGEIASAMLRAVVRS